MANEVVVPDWAKKQMPAAFVEAGLNAQDDNLAEGIGQSYGVVKYKGKVWSLNYRGQRHNILDPNGTPSGYLDVVIVGQAKGKSKSYYKAYDPNTSDGDRPICSSLDGITPDVDVTQKQADVCALCPRNVLKQNPATGRKGKECTDYKRLAVVIMPTQTKAVLGQPLMEPVFLRVPPDSLNSLAIMGDSMSDQGHHYSSYWTRITFDPDAAHPKMKFRALQGVSENEAPVVIGFTKDPIVGRITGGDVVLKAANDNRALHPASGQNPASGQTVHEGTVIPPSSHVAGGSQPRTPTENAATPGTFSNGNGGAPDATLSTKAADAFTSPTLTNGQQPPREERTAPVVDTGFGGVTSAAPAAPVQTVSETPATIVDAGEPQEADAALDAEIAALIGKKAS